MATANTNSFSVVISSAGADCLVSGAVSAQSATSTGSIDAFGLIGVSGAVTAQNAVTVGNVTAEVRNVTIQLTDETGAPSANLTGLRWAWFDQVTPDLFLAPTDKGTGETTDGSGNLLVEIPNSTLTSGQTGWLTVTDSDGTTAFVHKGFAGPADVS